MKLHLGLAAASSINRIARVAVGVVPVWIVTTGRCHLLLAVESLAPSEHFVCAAVAATAIAVRLIRLLVVVFTVFSVTDALEYVVIWLRQQFFSRF